ncbi:MAG: hypothetical protein IKT65_05990 [Clostridia bacterium]|nr:hypothetical protein [Clostridia bacterium]
MDNNNKQNGFSYTYSAGQQAEIKRIRERYSQSDEAGDKMKQLRDLDASVTKASTVTSLIFGIVGILLLGFGMSLIMTDISSYMGIYGSEVFIFGIAIGCTGLILCFLAYPIYNAITKAKRKKLAPEILRLADELMKNQN